MKAIRYLLAAMALMPLGVLAGELGDIEGIHLGSPKLPAKWHCEPMDAMGRVLGMETCVRTPAGQVFGKPIRRIEAARYIKRGRKVGMVFVEFEPQETPEFGKLLQSKLGSPKRLTSYTSSSATATWERGGYMVTLQRDDARNTANFTVTSNWAIPK